MVKGLKLSFRAFSSRGSSLMQSIAETCVRFDVAHLSINLVSEIAVPMFTFTVTDKGNGPAAWNFQEGVEGETKV